jgi:chromosome segregation ATPase
MVDDNDEASSSAAGCEFLLEAAAALESQAGPGAVIHGDGGGAPTNTGGKRPSDKTQITRLQEELTARMEGNTVLREKLDVCNKGHRVMSEQLETLREQIVALRGEHAAQTNSVASQTTEQACLQARLMVIKTRQEQLDLKEKQIADARIELNSDLRDLQSRQRECEHVTHPPSLFPSLSLCVPVCLFLSLTRSN